MTADISHCMTSEIPQYSKQLFATISSCIYTVTLCMTLEQIN